MWSSVKTEAIVLSSIASREADRRYCALTPTFGKLEFVGRGALKAKAKLAAHLEPCAIVELEVIRGARSTTVIGVERMHAFRKMSTCIDHRLVALTSMSLLDRMLQPDEEDTVLYEELLTWLRFVESQAALHPTRSTLLLGGFLLRIMRYLGYDSAHLDDMPKHAGAAILIALARKTPYADLVAMPLKGADVSAFAVYVHELLGYYVPGYADRPFWVGITAASCQSSAQPL